MSSDGAERLWTRSGPVDVSDPERIGEAFDDPPECGEICCEWYRSGDAVGGTLEDGDKGGIGGVAVLDRKNVGLRIGEPLLSSLVLSRVVAKGMFVVGKGDAVAIISAAELLVTSIVSCC